MTSTQDQRDPIPTKRGTTRARYRSGAVLVWICAVVGSLSACRSYDPDVLDARLRAATIDAYIDAIETQFGGLAVAGIEPGDLRDRYREAAVAAPSAAAFYGVLRALLADLDDPHATLRVSSKFWPGPVAEPELVRFVRSRGSVWMGAPPSSLRTEAELDTALEEWLGVLGATRFTELDQQGTADLLRLSAAFRVPDATFSPGAAAEPLVWLRVATIDGVPIETPHDAELMARGGLGTRARIEIVTDGGTQSLSLLRNAGVFEDDPDAGVRRRLGPLELATLLDPDVGRRRGSGRAPFRLRLRDPLQRPFRRGLRLDLPEEAARAFGVDAWVLSTPEGRSVGYLRIGSFRSRDVDTVRLSTEPAPPAPTLGVVLEQAFGQLADLDRLIIDLTGNPGGSWQETGLFVSYFMDPDDLIVPHDVVSVSEVRRMFFFHVRTVQTQRLSRADVPSLLPRQILVLVDQDTASAGEIAASALRGLAGAELVGERTAGAEFSTAEFLAPDGSVLTIGLGGGMTGAMEPFQGTGLGVDVKVSPHAASNEPVDLERWRASFRLRALAKALERIDQIEDVALLP